jgi:hypothetical protein
MRERHRPPPLTPSLTPVRPCPPAPAFSLCLGSSYFQRVMDGSPELLRYAALTGAGPRTYTGPAPAVSLDQLLLSETSGMKVGTRKFEVVTLPQ